MSITCWWCGIEPEQLFEITQLNEAQRRYLPNWPAGDHEHAENPPTPYELLDAGHRTLMRMRDSATGLR